MSSAVPSSGSTVKEDAESGDGCVDNPVVPNSVKTELSNFDAEVLASIERSVKDIPSGPFGPGAVEWVLQRRAPRGKHRKQHVVRQCYIPTSRIDDFIAGMQSGKEGAQCVFRRGIENRTRPEEMKDGPRSALHFWRFRCEYGPKDFSGIVKPITADLVPKVRRKVKTTLLVPPTGDAGSKKKPRAKRGTAAPRPRAPRKYKPKNTKVESADAVASAIPDLNMVPEDVTIITPVPALPLRKRAPRKKAVPKTSSPCSHVGVLSVDSDVPFVSTVSTVSIKTVRRRAPRKKGASAPDTTVCHSVTGDAKSGLGIPDLNEALPECDAVPPRKPRKPRGPKKTTEKTIAKPRGTRKKVLDDIGPLLTALCSAAENLSSTAAAVTDTAVTTEPVEGQSIKSMHEDSKEGEQQSGEVKEGARKSPIKEDKKPKKETRDSKKKWGNSIKKGCLAQFTVKILLHLPHVAEVCIIQARHMNCDGLIVHGGMKVNERSAFSAHLSPVIKAFVDGCLHHGDSIPQIMKKHIKFIKKWEADGNEITRDMLICTKDIRNISGKLASETYMLHSNDAQSVRMWVQRNPKNVFYYTETDQAKPVDVPGSLDGANMPFTIGIQTPWQKKMMAKYGNCGAVSVDATFGTNEKKFPLYTLMVFDEWHNGIPVAFVLTSRCAETDLTPWMRALNQQMVKDCLGWKPTAFIVDCAQGEINALEAIWPDTKIFLCLWHVRRAWQKNSCFKIADLPRRGEILQELGIMMYDKNSPTGADSATWAKDKIDELSKKYPTEQEFWDYMESQWLDKVHMWVVGYRNLSYAGQDTNAAIEGYHGFMKSILKTERSRMVGRRVDWCIHALTEDVLEHYWYKAKRKEKGFVDNKKMQNSIVTSIVKAQEIPDSDVTLPQSPGDHALVTSSQHRHMRYIVHNPAKEWAGCNCVWAQRGNICKHQVKVLTMIRPDIAEGTIARYCGRHAGNINGGLRALLTPQRIQAVAPVFTPVATPQPTPLRNTPTGRDIGETLHRLLVAMTEEVAGSHVMKEHLLAEFNQVLGRIRVLKAEIRAGTVNPFVGTPVLRTVDDGKGFSLVRGLDFLERGTKKTARKLRLGGH